MGLLKLSPTHNPSRPWTTTLSPKRSEIHRKYTASLWRGTKMQRNERHSNEDPFSGSRSLEYISKCSSRTKDTQIFLISLLTSIGWENCMKFVTGTLPGKKGYLFYLYFNFDVFLRNLKTRETFCINVDLFSIKFWVHLSFPVSPSTIICPTKTEGFIYVKQFGEPIDSPFIFWRFSMVLECEWLCDILQ